MFQCVLYTPVEITKNPRHARQSLVDVCEYVLFGALQRNVIHEKSPPLPSYKVPEVGPPSFNPTKIVKLHLNVFANYLQNDSIDLKTFGKSRWASSYGYIVSFVRARRTIPVIVGVRTEQAPHNIDHASNSKDNGSV